MCGFWPCGSSSLSGLAPFPRLSALACNFLNMKSAIYYFSEDPGPLGGPFSNALIYGWMFLHHEQLVYSQRVRVNCFLFSFLHERAGDTFSCHEIHFADEKCDGWLFSSGRGLCTKLHAKWGDSFMSLGLWVKRREDAAGKTNKFYIWHYLFFFKYSHSK